MAILLLGGTITPVLSQSSLDSNSIIINEVEINPQNGSEYVELYNPTSQPIDSSGWSLIPTTSWKILVVGSNTVIEPQSFLIFTHVPFWFKDFGDSLTLTNNSGELIDETPLLIDQDNDGKSWQRITDGLDSNSNSDWELKRMSPKSSNGTIIESTPPERPKTTLSLPNFSFKPSTVSSTKAFGVQSCEHSAISTRKFCNNCFPSVE